MIYFFQKVKNYVQKGNRIASPAPNSLSHFPATAYYSPRSPPQQFQAHANSSFQLYPSSTRPSVPAESNDVGDEANDAESELVFERLRDAERERVAKQEEFERKADVHLERQLAMALLTMRGKLKGTEWDPEDSHKIDYSDFLRLLHSNDVHFTEYSDHGRTMSA